MDGVKAEFWVFSAAPCGPVAPAGQAEALSGSSYPFPPSPFQRRMCLASTICTRHAAADLWIQKFSCYI